MIVIMFGYFELSEMDIKNLPILITDTQSRILGPQIISLHRIAAEDHGRDRASCESGSQV